MSKEDIREIETDLQELQRTFFTISSVLSKCINQIGRMSDKLKKLEAKEEVVDVNIIKTNR